MIALDSNVLLRLLVEDDETQRAQVVALFRRAEAEGAQLFVPDPVLCEVLWVLRGCYRRDRAFVASAVEVLAESRQLRFGDPDRVACAVARFRAGRGDFADYLIREGAEAEGCNAVATFDGELLGESGFVHPDPKRWDAGLSLHERAPRYGGRVRRRAARSLDAALQPQSGRPAASNISTGTAAAGEAANSSRSRPKTKRSPGPGSEPREVPRRQPSRR